MDQYEQGKFNQLAVAHKCSVLLFTKDKFSNLGKKLRPEFDKLFVSSELKDSIKLLSTSHAESNEPKNSIDLVRVPVLVVNSMHSYRSFSYVDTGRL